MDKYALQQQLELDYDSRNIGHILDMHKERLLAPCVDYIHEWQDNVDLANQEWLLDVVIAVENLDMVGMCWELLTSVMLQDNMTLHAVMGMFIDRFRKYITGNPYRCGDVLDVIIQAVLRTNQVEVKLLNGYNTLCAKRPYRTAKTERYGYVLPSLVPHKVKSNGSVAYAGMHVISGKEKLKRHDHNVCLDHIERLSNIAYKVDERIIALHTPVFDAKPKMNEKTGDYETPEEIEKKRKLFDKFLAELEDKVGVMVAHGNEFYLGHKYDTRLRTYLKAFHFDFVGNKHARAFVQPKKGAVINGTNKYL